MSEPIIFYDIPSKSTTSKAWSPNTWKVRFALNIKGLAYKTEWVEYPDIKPLYQKLGLPPTRIKSNGSGYHCLPVIHDPSTNTTMFESFDIIEYLDKTYPDTPALMPKEILPLCAAFKFAFGSLVIKKLWNVVVYPVWCVLNQPSLEYYRRTCEEGEGKKLEEICGEKAWGEVEKAFGNVVGWLDKGGEGTELFMGENITFPDLQVMGCLMWVKASCGEDSDGWRRVCEWHGGRWKTIHDRFIPYMTMQ
ncbi:hypothetical protein BC835DRAFT_1285958 [Cytidiella melzeri]|nr:hypothetical protein BC835DRAFT_1285958 [Cytidiella melzeri]